MDGFHQRFAQLCDSLVDRFVVRDGIDLGCDRDEMRCEVLIDVQHFERGRRMHSAPRGQPYGDAQRQGADQRRGEGIAIEPRADGPRDRSGRRRQKNDVVVDRPVEPLPRPRGNEGDQPASVGQRYDAGAVSLHEVFDCLA